MYIYMIVHGSVATLSFHITRKTDTYGTIFNTDTLNTRANPISKDKLWDTYTVVCENFEIYP